MLNIFIILILIVVISLSSYFLYESKKIEKFYLESKSLVIKEPINNEKIFVNIVSYRDPEVIKTVNNLIKNAEAPELLRIVVFENNGENDISVKPRENVEVYTEHYSKAKGPVWARYLAQQKYNGEQFYLQLDSHMRVVKQWDTEMKNMLNMLPEKSILTQYPPEYNVKNDSFNVNEIRSGLYIQGFGVNDKTTRIQSDIITDDSLKSKYPYVSKAWSGCFSFSDASMLKDAPYDPFLPFLFFGEEFDISVRLYTHGWNFYSPHKNLIYTTFKRNHRRTFWQDLSWFRRIMYEGCSRKRLSKRLNIQWTPNYFGLIPIFPWVNENVLYKEIEKYNLGTERTFEDYEKFAEIQNTKEQKMAPHAKTFRRFTTRPLLR